jgi:hypothetical protein
MSRAAILHVLPTAVFVGYRSGQRNMGTQNVLASFPMWRGMYTSAKPSAQGRGTNHNRGLSIAVCIRERHA